MNDALNNSTLGFQQKVTITDIKVRLVENGNDGLIAWSSCIISGAIKLDNIAIRRGRDGSLFLTYPAKRSPGGDKYHYFNPISTDAAQTVQDALLSRLAALAQLSANETPKGTPA